jgi:hypothetical protein
MEPGGRRLVLTPEEADELEDGIDVMAETEVLLAGKLADAEDWPRRAGEAIAPAAKRAVTTAAVFMMRVGWLTSVGCKGRRDRRKRASGGTEETATRIL